MNRTDKIIAQARKEGRKVLLENEAKTICAEYGISVNRFGLAKGKEDAARLALSFGFPVVLKIVSPEIVHKSEAGGVRLNLKNEAEVEAAYSEIVENAKKYNPKANVVGVLVQEMAPQGIETIVGAVKDPQFGPTIMFGLGGVFVELLKDVAFRVAPITEQDAAEMIVSVKAFPLLNGYRGSPPSDVKAIVNLLLSVSNLVTEHEEIRLPQQERPVYHGGA